MIASRSSKGINALFIAFTVTRCKSAKFQPNAPINSFISWVIEVLDINRLSVLTVILNLNLAKTPIGCSAIVFAAPVCKFEVGQSSNGIRRSLTYDANRPNFGVVP